MDTISRTLPAGLRTEASDLAAQLDARLRGQVVGIGWAHGDYLPVNLLTAPNGQVSAIFDWCTASPDSLSVLDVATFVSMAEAMTAGQEFGPVVRRWLEGVPRAQADVLVGCQSALGCCSSLPVLVLLGWLKHVSMCVSRSRPDGGQPGVEPAQRAGGRAGGGESAQRA